MICCFYFVCIFTDFFTRQTDVFSSCICSRLVLYYRHLLVWKIELQNEKKCDRSIKRKSLLLLRVDLHY